MPLLKKQGFSPLEHLNSLRFIYDLHKLINLIRTPHHVTQNVIFFDAIQCNKGQILRSWWFLVWWFTILGMPSWIESPGKKLLKRLLTTKRQRSKKTFGFFNEGFFKISHLDYYPVILEEAIRWPLFPNNWKGLNMIATLYRCLTDLQPATSGSRVVGET